MMLDEHDKRGTNVSLLEVQIIMNTLRDYGVMYTELLLCFWGIFSKLLKRKATLTIQIKWTYTVCITSLYQEYIIFVTGLLSHSCTSNSDSDSDLEGAEHFDTQSSDAVSMPHCSFNPCEQLLKELASLANPLSQCCSYGRSIYLAAIRVCGNHLTHDCDDCTQVE